jgi:hypothetical protein
MTSNPRKLYEATQTLFRAFHYLLPRMKGGGLALPQPMNPEALAGCILHGCMSRVVREIQAHRDNVALNPQLQARRQECPSGEFLLGSPIGWFEAERSAG